MVPDDAQTPKYRVGMVARLTGLSTHTLRMWEKRYEVVTPARTPAGGRMYNDAQVARLKDLAALVNDGHAIGSVAGLEPDSLRALLPRPQPVERGSHELSDPIAAARAEFLSAIERFDLAGAERILGRLAAALAPRAFIEQVVSPTMCEVGDRWHRGELRIVHEHLCTSVLRGLLFSLARLYPPREDARAVVVGTCAGELHELGALNVAILAGMHGLRVYYVGANLPADEFAYVAARTDADFVLISIISQPAHLAIASVEALRRAVPTKVRVIAGGAATHGLSVDGVEVFSDLDRLERELR